MNVIQRLRRKFIFVATIAVVIIIFVALGLIDAAVYLQEKGQVETIMQRISDNDGVLHHAPAPDDNAWFNLNWSDDTPEFAYQIRYFSILADKDGIVKRVNVDHIASFTEAEAVQYAQTTLDAGQEKGFFKKNLATYAYWITVRANGDHLIVIMDCTRDMAAVDTFIRSSVLLGIICILLYVLIVAAMSKVAVRPFVENMEKQKRFITNAGHELKTPVAIISANTETMELINGKSEWTTSILKQVRRLSNLINDLILLAKMDEEAQAEITFEAVDVTAAVNAVADSFRQVLVDSGKNLVTTVEADVSIPSQEKFLYEMINILVDNAVKYCDDGGTVAVTLRRRKKGKGAVFAVANTYVGGETADYTRFFERFYRGDTSHNSKKSGYGIGLSMAEEFAKILRGKLQVSYRDRMITFTVTF
ncbi:sensor histidine kinase [Megasphaera vaginalis (ex Bordigoni et al. 2020)]|uniref:sensor histidine kinase n=1 Tax=Megasphaera vaginalis (ex Bordigoni et al. 2020) TaxID=2045301 RepID=UPI000C7AE42C|nr:HAMP domain-containing sensor histidine kinase [Megasphaera vaginalis (ex Bordigoni et al. 2020)]